jgi:hypothetical protein
LKESYYSVPKTKSLANVTDGTIYGLQPSNIDRDDA